MKSLNIVNAAYGDLNPRVFGYDHCPAGRKVGPRAVNYTMIHYIESGKGTVSVNGETFTVFPGQAFIINAGEISTYTADPEDPWFYRYISFDGVLSADFSRLPRVFDSSPDFFRRVCDVAKMPCKKESMLASLLFEWHSKLCVEDLEKSNNYASDAAEYIRQNYMHNVTVDEIAKILFISRGYLGRIFKKEKGMSVQSFLVQTRISNAKRMLAQNMSVTETAYSCGFGDASNFSKLFKKHTGISPLQYRIKEVFTYTDNTEDQK